MAYPNFQTANLQTDLEGAAKNILRRKEFKWLANVKEYAGDDWTRGNSLKLHAQQLFTNTYMSPNTPNNRILIKHSTGLGKTSNALNIAKQYIGIFNTIYREQLSKIPNIVYSRRDYDRVDKSTPYVFIIGFTKSIMIRELLKFPEYGFITLEEKTELARLAEIARHGVANDRQVYKEMLLKYKRRITSKNKGGFFKFYGYQEFVNRLFLSDTIDLIDLESQVSAKNTLEDIINAKIQDKSIRINHELVESFNNSIIICDEIHHTYNSVMKNNYGVALQYILDVKPNVRAVFLTATVMNTAPSEIIDMMNYLLPNKLKKLDYFTADGHILPEKLDELGQLSAGRISFAQDINPRYYPEARYEGVLYKDLPYIKFTLCPISDLHRATFLEYIKTSTALDNTTLYDMVFPNPDSATIGLCTGNEIRNLPNAPAAWKQGAGLEASYLPTLSWGGEWLRADNIGKYSAKLAEMWKIILDSWGTDIGEKIFIYHENIQLSGVSLIRDFLKANDILDEISEPTENTKCAKCGVARNIHAATPKSHTYTPCRFVLAHSDLAQKKMLSNIELFNMPDNAYGDNYKFLVGSRLIRESFDLKDIKRLIILQLPQHISGYIQLIGRLIRNGSMVSLPADQRIGRIYTLLSIIPNEIGPEEERWRSKLLDYKEIQKIDQVLNKYAIDGSILRNIIMPDALYNKYFPSGAKQPLEQLGPLYFESKYNIPEETDLVSFIAYGFSKEEVNICLYIMKRLFLMNAAYTWDNLWQLIQEPPMDISINTKLINKQNFAIALSVLCDHDTSFIPQRLHGLISLLYDRDNKFIITDSGVCYKIVGLSQYYVRFPVIDGAIIRDIDMFIKPSYDLNETHSVDLGAWYDKQRANINFTQQIDDFLFKYKTKKVSEEIFGEYSPEFFNVLLAHCFENSSRPICAAVITLIDRFGGIIWYDEVAKLSSVIIKSRRNEVGYASAEALNILTDSGWTKISRQQIPRYNVNWIENEIQIGYYDMVMGGRIRFKMRPPIVKQVTDLRLFEKGSVCETKTKQELFNIYRQFKLPKQDSPPTVKDICRDIVAHMLKLESKERAAASSIKYVYMYFDNK